MVTLLAAFAACLAPTPAAGEVTVAVEPPQLQVSTLSGQMEIRITAQVDPAAQPVVVIRGHETEAAFSRKVQAGPIWLSSGQVHVSRTPTLLLRFSPGPIDSLLSREDIDAHQLDAEAIRKHMHVEPAEFDAPAIRDSYMALQTENGSYRFVENDALIAQPGGIDGAYAVDLPWPMTAPTGTYEVALYECRDGAVTAIATAPFDVIAIGLVAWLAASAADHAGLYGVVAVAVAVSLGFGIDFLVSYFRRRGGRSSADSPGHMSAH